MNDTIDRLEDWGQKMAEAIYWCQTNLKPDTWRYYKEGTLEIDNDKDYTLFLLSTRL